MSTKNSGVSRQAAALSPSRKLSGMSTDREVHPPIQVKTETLDSFCETQQISQIDFLKIDTEGGEFEVLKGARNLLERKRIVNLQFECGGTYWDAKITLKQVLAFLLQCGYNLFRILPDGLLHIKEWNDSLETYRYSNYLAIIPDLDLRRE